MVANVAGEHHLLGVARGVLMAVPTDLTGIKRIINLPVVLTPGFGRNLFSRVSAAEKGALIVIAESSSIDMQQFKTSPV